MRPQVYLEGPHQPIMQRLATSQQPDPERRIQIVEPVHKGFGETGRVQHTRMSFAGLRILKDLPDVDLQAGAVEHDASLTNSQAVEPDHRKGPADLL